MTFFSNKIFIISCAIFLLFTTGCTLLPGIEEAPTRVQLTPQSPQSATITPTSKKTQLVVLLPKVSLTLNSDGVACIFNGREVRNLKGVRFVAPVPEVLQQALIYGLDETGAFASVSDGSGGISSLIELRSDIKQFALFYGAEKTIPIARLEGLFRLINVRTGIIFATLPVNIEVQAKGKEPEFLTDAIESTLSALLVKLEPWIVTSMSSKKAK